MDKKINRIKINELYSENNIFDKIIFHDGINIILGEKYDNDTIKGRKTNGVGKSLCVEFINFCFLCQYKGSRLEKIPENILPLNENIILDFKIGESNLIIKRNRKNESKPIIIKDGKNISFDKLTEATSYLNDLLFSNTLQNSNIPSFRSLLSILIREERSEFNNILQPFDSSKRIPIQFIPHLFLIGININAYNEILDTIKEIEEITNKIKTEKNILTKGNKKISDIQAELNALNDDLNKMELALNTFKSNEAFDSIQKEIIELEIQLEQFRTQQKALKCEYKKIKSMPKPEEIDDMEIESIYNEFKKNLGSNVVKSLRETIEFKNKIEDFQRTIINEKAKELETQLNDISEAIRELDEEYAEKMKILDQEGILKNFKVSLNVYEAKKNSIAQIKPLFEQYQKDIQMQKQLQLQKSQQILNLDDILTKSKLDLDNLEKTFLSIHEKIMGNQESFFNITTIDKKSSKVPISIELRIFDDGSHSVNRTKVFIYDVGLMFNSFENNNHPKIIIHDNLFDVDQDTLTQCLNYLAEQEEKYLQFQYILTLNRDKIENEERLNLIKLNIDEHTIASFTKQNKFLHCDYQEK